VESPFWNGVELSVSFDTGEGTTKQVEGTRADEAQAVTLSPTVTGGRFTSATIRWSSDPKNARSQESLKRWKDLARGAIDGVERELRTTARPAEAQLRELQQQELQLRADDPDFAFLVRQGWSYSFAGSYSTPALQPKTWTARIIASWAPDPCEGDCASGAFTFNFAYTGYLNAQPTGDGDTTRSRDFTAAVQFDRRIGRSEHALAITLGGYGQWQGSEGVLQFPADSATLPGTTIPIPPEGLKILTEKGWLGAFQAGLVFTLPGGVKAPLTLAYSNRTEFRKRPEVRAFFGVLLNTFALQN
jgi:hypothetical protein